MLLFLFLSFFYIVIWKKEISNNSKLSKNSELEVRIELTTLRVLVLDALTTELLEALWRARSKFNYK